MADKIPIMARLTRSSISVNPRAKGGDDDRPSEGKAKEEWERAGEGFMRRGHRKKEKENKEG